MNFKLQYVSILSYGLTVLSFHMSWEYKFFEVVVCNWILSYE